MGDRRDPPIPKDVYGIGRGMAAFAEAAVLIFLIFVIARCSGVEVF